jgi:hypothetical protein
MNRWEWGHQARRSKSEAGGNCGEGCVSSFLIPIFRQPFVLQPVPGQSLIICDMNPRVAKLSKLLPQFLILAAARVRLTSCGLVPRIHCHGFLTSFCATPDHGVINARRNLGFPEKPHPEDTVFKCIPGYAGMKRPDRSSFGLGTGRIGECQGCATAASWSAALPVWWEIMPMSRRASLGAAAF